MSTKTFCDVCGREAMVKAVSLGSVYEGGVSVASAFDGDICGECSTRVDKAASKAILREMAAIREEAR